MGPIASNSTTNESMDESQKRLSIEVSSGSSSSDKVGCLGSNAIPHFGHDPGFELMTSGCMGQVYFTVFCDMMFLGLELSRLQHS
ncbi:MAG: hypothetical protein F9K49_07735 [Caedimonadaceae bacterium]|nr:MAG: hypothetical protein F9K49_07735 [Caedimonadaceae bacterium]